MADEKCGLVRFQPARPVLMAAGALLAASLAIGTPTLLFYLREGRLEEWMIYRLLLGSLLVTTSSIFVSPRTRTRHPRLSPSDILAGGPLAHRVRAGDF